MLTSKNIYDKNWRRFQRKGSPHTIIDCMIAIVKMVILAMYTFNVIPIKWQHNSSKNFKGKYSSSYEGIKMKINKTNMNIKITWKVLSFLISSGTIELC